MTDARDQEALATGLRDAFALVAAADIAGEEKARWQQRLLAITNASKRDGRRALASLERFTADWQQQHPS